VGEARLAHPELDAETLIGPTTSTLDVNFIKAAFEDGPPVLRACVVLCTF
jgi:hypothetical protein